MKEETLLIGVLLFLVVVASVDGVQKYGREQYFRGQLDGFTTQREISESYCDVNIAQLVLNENVTVEPSVWKLRDENYTTYERCGEFKCYGTQYLYDIDENESVR